MLATYVVDTTIDTNSMEYQACTAADDDCSLRGAITKANGDAAADIITFATPNGTPITLTISGDDDMNASGDLDIRNSLTITGNGPANTIIQAGTNTSNGIDKVFGLNPACAPGRDFTLTGMTVRFGRNTTAHDTRFQDTGGGIDWCGNGTGANSPSLNLDNMVITQNSTIYNGAGDSGHYGGGLNLDEVAPSTGTVSITNTIITNNTATAYGGGVNIFGDNLQVTISGSTISNNGTLGTFGVAAQGGGINIRISNNDDMDGAPVPFVNISNTTVMNNQGVGYGGGICVQGSGNQNVNVSNTAITGNSLIAGGVIDTTGGGLYHDNDPARTTTLTNVLIANNTSTGSAGSVGGGLSLGSGNLIARNTTITGNSAKHDGGGVWVAADQTLVNPLVYAITLTNSTISNNRTDSDNNSSGSGGGLFKTTGPSTATLQNTLVDGNFKGTGSVANEIAGAVTANFSLIGNTSGAMITGANNQNGASGRLAALANNGGQTVGPAGFTAVLQTHALLAGSPALDNGNNTFATGASLTTDQRGTGFTRILDAADANTTDTVDIGAFEAHPTVEDLTNQTIIQPTALSTSFNVGDSNFTSGINSITVTSSNTTLVPNANINVGGTGTNTISNSTNSSQTLVITPVADQVGTTTITVTATDTVNGTTQTMSDTFTLMVTASADLAITKTDGATTAIPGGSTIYTITASNAGPSPVAGATVTDAFPAPFTGTWTCVGSGGGSCTAAGFGNINDSVTLPAGASVTYTVSGTISDAATGTLSNTASISSATPDPIPGNNSATDTDTLTPLADLAITKTDGVTMATPGGMVTYTITASNAGPSNAPSAMVSDTFPAKISSATWTCVGAGGGTCTASSSGNINDTVNLPAGGSVTYTVSATISGSATGTLSNTATVAVGGGVTDPTPGNNSATDSDTLAQTADLSITKTDGVTVVIPGNLVTYTITASNAGPNNAPVATVTDTFPAAITSVSWTCVGAGGGTCTASGSTDISDSVNLPVGASVTYTVMATTDSMATGNLVNTATVTIGGGVTDPNSANNSATDTDALDNTPPSTTSFTRKTPAGSPTNFDTLIFLATFSEGVTGVDLNDFAVTGTSGTISVMQVTPSTYDVTISGGDLAGLEGTVGLDFNSPTITDLAGNALPGIEPAIDETYLVENTAPSTTSFTRKTPATSTTNADTLVFLVTFSEDMTGVDMNDFFATGTTGTIAVSQVTPSTYDVTISNGDLATVNGTVGLNFVGSPRIKDLAGNSLPNTEPTIDETYVLDNLAPSTTSFTRKTPATSPTNQDMLVFLATFSEDVTGVDMNDFAVSGSTATISVMQLTPSTYNVTLSGSNLANLNATVGLNLVASPSIMDLADNSLPNTEPTIDQTYVVDNTPPIATSFALRTPASSPTNADELVFRVTFNELVMNVGPASFAVNGSTATVADVSTPGGFMIFDVTVNGGNLAGFDGTVGLNFSGTVGITDQAGNLLLGNEPATNQIYTLDNLAPTVTSFTRKTPAAEYTNVDTLVFLATFSEDVMNVDAGDFTVTGAGTVNNVSQVTPNTYDVTISGGTLASFNGTVDLNLAPLPSINDPAGNALTNLVPTSEQMYVVDNLRPSVTINQANTQTDPGYGAPIRFTAVFSEPVTGFMTGDVSISGSAGAMLASISQAAPNDGTTYNVSVTGMTGAGLVIVSINANVATDLAGNLSNASTSTDNTVTYSPNAPPMITSPATANVAENTTAVMTLTATDSDLPAQTITFTLVGGADRTKFTLGGNSLRFTTPPDFEAPTDSGMDNVYDVQVQASDGNGGTALQTISVTVTNAVDPVLVDRTLLITGSAMGDSFTVSLDPGGIVKVVQSLGGAAGSEHRYPLASIGLIEVNAGDGNDSVFISQNLLLPTLIDGGGGNDFLRGSNQSNILVGGPGNDQIHGGNSRDILIGSDGSDTVYAYAADDVMIGVIANNPRAELLDMQTKWLHPTKSFAERSDDVRAIAKPVAAAGSDLLIGSTGMNLTITPAAAGAALDDATPPPASAADSAGMLNDIHPLIASNPFESNDINGDGEVTARDALASINDMNAFGVRSLFVYSGEAIEPGICNIAALLADGGDLSDCHVRGAENLFLDASLDDILSPLDSLLVINAINSTAANAALGQAESEGSVENFDDRGIAPATELNVAERTAARGRPSNMRAAEPSFAAVARDDFELIAADTIPCDLLDLLARDL